jgi:hypothetical protein
MDNTEILLKLKKDIEEAKIKKAQLEGKLQTFEEQLKKEFQCDNIEQAENIITDLNQEIKVNENEFEKQIEEIKELL